MDEIWKDITGYEGLYQVSNFGRIKSLERYCKSKNDKVRKVPEKIMLGTPNSSGYMYVTLSKDGVSKACRLHHIIALTFCENPNNYLYINHKDENIKNNCSDNLEWCSVEYNINYGHHNERVSQACRNRQDLSIPVCQLDANTLEVIAEFPSTREAGRVTGNNQSNISKCCRHKNYTIGGYKWSYKN